MGSKYSSGDMIKCVKEYKMNSGKVAFIKGRVYSITDVDEYDEGSETEPEMMYEYHVKSEISDGHVIQEQDVTRHFKVITTMPIVLHKYYCGCYGIPVDSINALIVKACDGDYGELCFSMRDMRDKKHEPMSYDDQEELIHKINEMIGRGEQMTRFAMAVGFVNRKK